MTGIQADGMEVLERIDDGFFALNEAWEFTYLNERAGALLDVDETDLIGETIWEVYEPAVGTAFEREYRHAMDAQESVSFEAYYPPLEAWFEVRAYPSESGLSVYFRDVTERKATAGKLERYESIVETMEDGVYVVDGAGHFEMVNDAFADLVGYDREELLGAPVTKVVDEETAAAASELERKLKAGERSTATSEATIERPDGRRVEAEATFSMLPSGDGRVGVIRDVTERKARTRRLERYERIVDAVEDGVYVLDAENQFVIVNDAFCEMTGYDRGDLVGRHATAVKDERVVAEIDRLVAGLARDERESTTIEFDLQTSDGGRVPVEDRVQYISLDEGDGRCGIVRGVSERKEFERQLVALHEVAVDLAQADSAEAVAGIVTDAVHDILDAPAAFYYGYDRDSDVLEPVTISDSEDVIGVDLPTVETDEETLIGSVFGSGRTRNIDDVTESSHYEDSTGDIDIRSGMLAPVGDEGVLGAGAATVDAFDDRMEQLIDIVATAAETALERVADEQTLEDQRDRLAALNEINSLVHDIAESAFGLSAREEIGRVVCERLADSASYEFAWIGVADDDEVAVETERGVEGYLDEAISLVDAPDDAGPTARAHLTGEMQVVQNVHANPQYEPWQATAREYGFDASASIPIRTPDEQYGSLNVYSSRADAFGEEERDALDRLGSILGYAISSVERDRQLERERNRLEFMNRLLRHNLLNSLHVVQARLEMLDGRVDYEVADHLETAVGRTREMATFVETIRDVTRVVGRGAEQDLEAKALDDVLADRVETAEQAHPSAEFTLESAPDVEVVADDLLGEALDNVLANAVQHNPADTPRVWVDVVTRDDAVEVTVADDGPGIPDERKATVFDRESKDFDDPGSGFGLYLVSEIMESYDGSITVADNDPTGAVFTLTFQRA